MVIEGGVNTQQPLARIISIHPDGAAFQNGFLKVGQIIQEVDGFKLDGKFISITLFSVLLPLKITITNLRCLFCFC